MPHVPRNTAPMSLPLDLAALSSQGRESRRQETKQPLQQRIGLETISLRNWQVDPAKVLEQMTGKKPKKLFGSLVDPDNS